MTAHGRLTTARPSRRVPVAVVAAAGLLLAGCTGAAPGASDASSAATGTGASSGEPSASATPDPTSTGSGTPDAAAPGPATGGSGTVTSGGAASGTRAVEQFTPLLATVPTTPRWFTGSDGVEHLTYEIRLTNAFPVAATVTRLVVRDADTGTVLQDLSGEALSGTVTLLTAGATPLTEVPASTVAVAWMDVPLPAGQAPPRRLTNELTVTVPPGLPVPETIVSTGDPVSVDTAGPTVLGPPLQGPGWFAVGSCCDGPHRRTAQPIDNELWVSQRFAIDFNRLDDRGYIVTGDRSRNESYPTYDQPVLAVADAVVVQTADRYPDQVPEAAEPVTIEEADGNFVILQVADGVYAFYAHLKPGTVQVSAGDRVTRGQQIGRTGNSGSSTGPHLHFQLMDRPSALAADGLPYEFDRFTVTGRGPSLADLVAGDPGAAPLMVDPANAGPRTDELPLSRDVVEFAGSGSSNPSPSGTTTGGG